MSRYAIIDIKNQVINNIEWDGISDWKPPEDCKVVENKNTSIGDLWNEEIKDFVRPLKNMYIDDPAVDERL